MPNPSLTRTMNEYIMDLEYRTSQLKLTLALKLLEQRHVVNKKKRRYVANYGVIPCEGKFTITSLTNKMQEIEVNETKDAPKDEEEHERISKLPNVILQTIWTKVLVDDPAAVGFLRSVCKYWKSNIELLPLLTKYDEYPYLVSLKGSNCRFFQPTYNGKLELTIPALQGASIRFSKYGWLLLSRHSGRRVTFDFFFFNLSTGQKISLPQNRNGDFLTMYFWSPPTSSDCFVIGIPMPGMNFSIFRMNNEDKKWQNYGFDQENGVSQSCHPIKYKEKYYCMLSTGKLAVFDPETRSISFFGESLPEDTIDCLYRFHLVEDEDDLLAVFVPTHQTFPYVMKMDMVENKWVPAHDLSNKLLYVSSGSSFTHEDSTRSNGNKIYFPKFNDRKSVFYSFAKKEYVTILRDYSRENPLCVKEIVLGSNLSLISSF